MNDPKDHKTPSQTSPSSGSGTQSATEHNGSHISHPGHFSIKQVPIKIQIIKDIWYEIYQYFKSADYLYHTSIPIDGDSEFLKNAILECHLIHFRALIWFFDISPSKDFDADNALASEYVPRFKSPKIINKQTWERLNKDLAHISKQRTKISYQDTVWNWPKYVDLLKPTCRDFIAVLKAEYSDQINFGALNEWKPLESLLWPEE